MTIEEIKRDLPTVKIRYNGEIWTASVTGRLNEFATVSPYSRSKGKFIDIIVGPCFQFSWEAVAKAVNEGTVLEV